MNWNSSAIRSLLLGGPYNQSLNKVDLAYNELRGGTSDNVNQIKEGFERYLGRLREVSWVRRRDYHLLTVGRQVYSSDARVGVKVSPDGCDWTLTVRWVATHDAGLYECQVSSHPPQALMINLSVVEAHAEIIGGTERFIHSGSSLMLVCLLKGATEPPTFVFWYRGDRMINYDKERGVTVDNTKKLSKLYVTSVSREDEGNYTCLPSNASPASVSVTVVQREHIERRRRRRH
ncbi:opioid-binding protein/cell adhesion molecule homolog [Palaemon carinicauda]|uniref:opioid-binding protein/cell adhesion molecule homolog n=1 Tax=Palaemon carinicauda TaxID=392227 RepID=UPI0035B629DA